MITVHDLRHVEPDVVEAWADHITRNMRAQDIEEIEASGSVPPDEAVMASLALSSHGYCVVDRVGEPCAMFGAAPHPLPGVGVAWMLGTDGIRREAQSIARQTPLYIEQLHTAYSVLWNYIDARNSISKRWLRWGGFELLKDVELGGHHFHIFARTDRHVSSQTAGRHEAAPDRPNPHG